MSLLTEKLDKLDKLETITDKTTEKITEKITEKSLKDELDDIFDVSYKMTKYTNPKISVKNKKKLVLSGGGSKGMAHIGALHALDEVGILDKIDTYAATSIGGFIAFMIYIGYKPLELLNILKLIDFSKLTETNMNNIFTKYGIDEGNKIIILIHKLMKGKGIDPKINFINLYKITKKTLIVTATCVNDKKCYYLSHQTSPTMSVCTAIRMTISFPLYFSPVTYQNKLFIDGGCIDNYPFHLFSKNPDEVLGIYLTDCRNVINSIDNIEEYIMNMIECFFEGYTINGLKEYLAYSIKINLENCSSIDFSITEEKKQLLFDIGYNITKQSIIK